MGNTWVKYSKVYPSFEVIQNNIVVYPRTQKKVAEI